MADEFDVNRIVAEFITHNIENFYSSGKDILKGASDKVRLLLRNSYKNYLTCVTERYSKAKSFFIRDQPVHLYGFYVPVGLKSGNTIIKKATFESLTDMTPFSILTGTGGSGKSMLMRHLFIDAVSRKDKVPIYLELRDLNNSDLSLKEFIVDTLHRNSFTLDEAYIERALKAGHFALLVDGFDEVARAKRKDISKQLLRLAKDYDQNAIIISSRPDNEFSGWPTFTVFEVTPLTLDQACELVTRLPFEEDLKNKFIKDLRQRLFTTHSSFLSNPLLLSIMLLTYGLSADIPSKLSVFYNQAYEALFQRHDALKSGFQRDRLSQLDIQDFGKVFSAFSMQTYDKRIFQMSKSDALDYLDKSKSILRLNFDTAAYLSDAEQAVCLLVEDGLFIAFSHRSFQEYFVARFICNSNPKVQEKLINRYAANIAQDSVMDLLYEMNPELVERVFIIPAIDRLQKSLGIKKSVGISHYVKYLKHDLELIEFANGKVVGLYMKTANRHTQLVHFALRNCGYLIGWHGYSGSVWGNSATWQKYDMDKDKTTRIRLSGISSRDNLAKDMAQSGFYGITPLQDVLKLRDALIRKHESSEESLDEILQL